MDHRYGDQMDTFRVRWRRQSISSFLPICRLPLVVARGILRFQRQLDWSYEERMGAHLQDMSD